LGGSAISGGIADAEKGKRPGPKSLKSSMWTKGLAAFPQVRNYSVGGKNEETAETKKSRAKQEEAENTRESKIGPACYQEETKKKK